MQALFNRILEQNLMTMARQMLFITILFDAEITSSNEKAKMFLEILGNTQLRKATFQVFSMIFPRLIFEINTREMYICWSVMCRLSRMVQDSYCTEQ